MLGMGFPNRTIFNLFFNALVRRNDDLFGSMGKQHSRCFHKINQWQKDVRNSRIYNQTNPPFCRLMDGSNGGK